MDISYIELSLTPHLKDIANELAIVDGMPFIINEDLKFDSKLNEVIKSIVDPKRRSKKTWKTYSEEIALYLRFMNAQEVHWLDADAEIIKRYWRARRLCSSPHKKNGEPIETSSWNLAVSALNLLYNSALDKKLIKRLPFKEGEDNESNNASRLKERKKHKVKRSIDIKQYRKEIIPCFQNSRNSEREVSLSNFLITTGCRIQEALNINIHDLPNPDSPKYRGKSTVQMKIIGKGNKEREIRIPKYVLHEINIYIREERADTIDRWKIKNQVNCSNQGVVPDALWLSERGTRLTENSVEKKFIDASNKTGLHVHPHMLRHTYAIYTLSWLIKIVINKQKDSQTVVYEKVIRDPIRTLQRLMGHAYITTTYEYLDYIDEEEDYISEALDSWNSEIYKSDLEVDNE